jgi:hypothetical protein
MRSTARCGVGWLTALLLLGPGCEDRNIRINLVSRLPIPLSAPARLKFTLYGYDDGIVDQEATPLKEYVLDLSAVPQSVALAYEDSLGDRITPRYGEMLAFYLYYTADTNGDGLVGPGDLAQDYAVMTPSSKRSIGELSGDDFIRVTDSSFPVRPW